MALSRLGCTPVFSKGFHSTIGFGIDGGAGAGPSDEAGGGEGIAARGKPLIRIMFAFIITIGRVSRSKNAGVFSVQRRTMGTENLAENPYPTTVNCNLVVLAGFPEISLRST